MLEIHMFVYNNMNTDARVQRCVQALERKYTCLLISIDKKWLNPTCVSEILTSNKNNNTRKYFNIMWRFIQVEKKKSCDIFYAHDFSAAMQAIYMKLRKKCKWLVYDAHELFIPEDGVSMSFRDRFFYHMERLAIYKADLVICAQEDRGRIMKEHYKLERLPIVIRNISVLPVCNELSDKGIQQQYEEYFSREGITIVYAGAIEKERQIDKMIRAVSSYRLHKCKALIIGNGSYKAELESLVQNEHLGNITFMPGMQYSELSYVLKQCDIGYLSYSEDRLNTKYCSPNKIYEYASVGLPMVSTGNCVIGKILSDNNIGCSGESIDSSLSDVISNLTEMRESCKGFIDNNKWIDEENKLITAIQKMIKAE